MSKRFLHWVRSDRYRSMILCIYLVGGSFVGFCMYKAITSPAEAQTPIPTTLSARQFQAYCQSGKTICDIDNFRVVDTHTIHFLAPDPLSETISGSWNKHCAQFSNIPGYVSVQELDLDTMQMVGLTQNVTKGDFQTCEAYFILPPNAGTS